MQVLRYTVLRKFTSNYIVQSYYYTSFLSPHKTLFCTKILYMTLYMYCTHNGIYNYTQDKNEPNKKMYKKRWLGHSSMQIIKSG